MYSQNLPAHGRFFSLDAPYGGFMLARHFADPRKNATRCPAQADNDREIMRDSY